MLVRRSARSAALLTVPVVALFTTPALAAGVPEGWSNPDPVEPLHFLFIVAGAPVILFLVIALLTAAPALIRGEKVFATTATEGEWLGGPRQGTEALPAPDGEGSAAGGASGSF
jgi:hypothetical protein